MGPQLNQKSNYATCRQDKPSKLRKHIFILASAFILLQLQWKRENFEGNVNLIAIVVNFSIFERKWSHKLTEEFFLGFFYGLLVFLQTNHNNYFIWNIFLFKNKSGRRFGWSLCRKPLEGDQFHAIWSLWSISSWTLSQIPTIDTENHFHCCHKYQQLKTRGKSFFWPFRDSGASSSGFPSERPGPS